VRSYTVENDAYLEIFSRLENWNASVPGRKQGTGMRNLDRYSGWLSEFAVTVVFSNLNLGENDAE
jgi:hypothetical protein